MLFLSFIFFYTMRFNVQFRWLQLYFLASDYASNCCSGPDENCNNSTSHSNANLSGSCGEVYVWGSNCTHQLAEGGQEKITTPKYSAVFTDCQQVSAYHLSKLRVPDPHLSSQTLNKSQLERVHADVSAIYLQICIFVKQ